MSHVATTPRPRRMAYLAAEAARDARHFEDWTPAVAEAVAIEQARMERLAEQADRPDEEEGDEDGS